MAEAIIPPFGPPDCPWVKMSAGSSLPDTAAYLGGKLHGDQVYIGRVFADDCYLIGTAVPAKGTCIYLNKKHHIKSTPTYEILTVDCGEPLEFQLMALDSHLLFVAGGDVNKYLYCARFVSEDNTYIGWADADDKTVFIPREWKDGGRVKTGYEVLIHKYLDRLCICPPAPIPLI